MSVLESDKNKKSKATSGENPENGNNIDHDVPALEGEKNHEKRDHYHDEHHFTAKGAHDDVTPDDFSLKSHFAFTRKNLTFKIAATSVFLGLAIVATLIDVLSETIFSIPINGVKMNIRILDLLVVIISIPTLGLIFSEFIAIVIPWIHFLLHSDHSPVQIVFDMLSYMVVVFLFWSIFYLLFRNSVFHIDPNKKVDAIKRWAPMGVIIPVAAFAATALYLLSLYVVSLSGGGITTGHAAHDHSHGAESANDIWGYISPRHAAHDHEGHEGHDHSGDASWGNIQGFVGKFAGAAFGIQLARFILFYLIFAVVEKRMKPVNHRFM
ncbi:hypothetical protein [Spiroplasma alleghenense]|uniref:Transmembrane protein n=1 Tax=Spiroplasma alleghenense TaxID=216931 RepID=A0A345Z494_9MOLU|nr:hypothetical protein [Spiroplasma alleghenense]AXK51423.1 transmembrane protein [Spiroplasma alleghenense]